jgi:hypothetical protein
MNLLGDGSQHFKTQIKIASAIVNPIPGPIIAKVPQNIDTAYANLSHEGSHINSV